MSILWPFIPSTIGETLKFNTDIRMTSTGEFRDSLHAATQIMTFNHAVNPRSTATRIEQTFRHNIAGNWLVPIWHFATELTSGADYADTTITVDSADYRAGGQALIYEGPNKYELVDIETYAAGVITLPSGDFISQDYAAGSWVCPVLPAIVPNGLGRGIGINRVDYSLTFYVTESVDLAAANYTTYGGYDGIDDDITVSEMLDGGLRQKLDFIDNGFGRFELVQDETYSRWRGTVRYTDKTHATRWARRQHLDRCRGRDRPFLLPTFNADLLLGENRGPSPYSTVRINDDYIVDPASVVGRRVYLAVGGASAFSSIASISLGVITLPAPITITASLGDPMSFAHLVRYDTDVFELIHARTSDGWLSSFSASVLEVAT